MRTISTTALRRLVIGAQGYATRSRRGGDSEVEETIRLLSCVQLDSIAAVERSHRIVLGSRVGAYARDTVSRLLGEVVVAGRVNGFQRLYDLPERVLPREVLDAPVRDEAARVRDS